MTANNDELGRLLNADPLAKAEEITGKSYKSDEATSALGVLGLMSNTKAKKEALSAAKDTYWGCPWKYAEEIIGDLGFEQILVRPFLVEDVYSEGKKNRLEYQVFYWRKDGILMVVDTYGGENGTVNSLSLYYNVEFLSTNDAFSVASSGHLHSQSYDEGRFIWIGHHEIHEGLRYKLAALENSGVFLPTWVEDPFLYLQHYGKKGNVSVAETLAQFPEEVQNALVAVDRTKPHYNEVHSD